MKRLFVHIGTHKTGTSAIQEALCSQEEKLLAHGYLYPNTMRGPGEQRRKHSRIVDVVRTASSEEVQSEARKLVRELTSSDCHSAIVSAEGLSGRNPKAAKFFEGFQHPGLEVHIICYLRRQDIYARSLYSQMLREPRRQTMTFDEAIATPQVLERLNYHKILTLWKPVASSITALDYEKERSGGSIVSSFVKHVGLTGMGIENRTVNISPDDRLNDLLLHINRNAPQKKIGKLLAAARSVDAASGSKSTTMTYAQAARILKRVKETNKSLLKDFGVAFEPLRRDQYPRPDDVISYYQRIIQEMLPDG